MTDPFPPVLTEPTTEGPPYRPEPAGGQGESPSTAEAAKEAARETGSTAKDEAGATASTAASETKEVAGTAAEGARQVAGEATRQVREVAQEATNQARTLAYQARDQIRRQAHEQTTRAAESLRQVSRQARSLAEGDAQGAGQVGEYVGRFADRASGLAERLEDRGFDGVIEDVQRFARRRPALFIGLAAAAGFAVSRIARSASNGQDQDPWYDGRDGRSSSTEPSHELPPPLGVHGGVVEPLPPAAEVVDLTVDVTPAEVGATSDPLDIDDRLDRGTQGEVR